MEPPLKNNPDIIKQLLGQSLANTQDQLLNSSDQIELSMNTIDRHKIIASALMKQSSFDDSEVANGLKHTEPDDIDEHVNDDKQESQNVIEIQDLPTPPVIEQENEKNSHEQKAIIKNEQQEKEMSEIGDLEQQRILTIIPPQSKQSEAFEENKDSDGVTQKGFNYQELENFLNNNNNTTTTLKKKKNLIYPKTYSEEEKKSQKSKGFLSIDLPLGTRLPLSASGFSSQISKLTTTNPAKPDSNSSHISEVLSNNDDKKEDEMDGIIPSDQTISSVGSQSLNHKKQSSTVNKFDSKQRFTNVKKAPSFIENQSEIQEAIIGTTPYQSHLHRFFADQVNVAGINTNNFQSSQMSMATVVSKDTRDPPVQQLSTQQIKKIISQQVEKAISATHQNSQQQLPQDILLNNEAFFRKIIQEEFQKLFQKNEINHVEQNIQSSERSIQIGQDSFNQNDGMLISESGVLIQNPKADNQRPKQPQRQVTAHSSSRPGSRSLLPAPPALIGSQKHIPQASHSSTFHGSQKQIPAPPSKFGSSRQLPTGSVVSGSLRHIQTPSLFSVQKREQDNQKDSALPSSSQLLPSHTSSKIEQNISVMDDDTLTRSQQKTESFQSHQKKSVQKTKFEDSFQKGSRSVIRLNQGEVSFSNNRVNSIQNIQKEQIGSDRTISFSNARLPSIPSPIIAQNPMLTSLHQTLFQEQKNQVKYPSYLDPIKNDTIASPTEFFSNKHHIKLGQTQLRKEPQSGNTHTNPTRQIGYQELINNPPSTKQQLDQYLESSIELGLEKTNLEDSVRVPPEEDCDIMKENKYLSKIWESALEFIERGQLNRAYQTILDIEDDVYLIRLMTITGPCFKKLNQNVGRKLIRRMNEVMKSQFLDQLGLDIFSQANKHNLTTQLSLGDSQNMKQILYDISASPSLGYQAAMLYNAIEKADQN